MATTTIEHYATQDPAHIKASLYLDMARRRAVWKDIAPLMMLLSIISGIATASFGMLIMICVMAATFTLTAIVGRLVRPL